LRQIYQGLVDFDYTAIVPSLNFQDPRYKPTTSVEGHVRQQNRDKIIWFLEDWVKENLNLQITDNTKYKNEALFEMYSTWCEASKVKMHFNKISFGMRITVLMKKQLNTGGFSCVKKDTSHCTTTLCMSEFIRYFKNLNGFEFSAHENDKEIVTDSSMKRKLHDPKHSCNSTFCSICLANKRTRLGAGANPSMIPQN